MAIATLPIVLSVVLTELAVGGSFLGWWVDRGGRAPGGFLKLVAFVDAGAIAAALALVPVFPRGDLADAASINTGPLGAFGQALILVTVLVIIQLVTAFLPARGIRIAAGILTTVAGVLALAIVALAMRRNLLETDAFLEAQTVKPPRRESSLRALFHYPREVLLVIGLTMGGTTAFYTWTTYM